MPITDGCAYIHGTGSSAFGPISYAAGVWGDVYSGAGAMELELDRGADAGVVGLRAAQFPGDTEKGYTFPPETLDSTEPQIGLHVVITNAFGSNPAGGTTITVYTSATASQANSGNAIGARFLSLAQLQVKGAHYFIPIATEGMLEYLNAYGVLGSGSNNTTGKIVAWIGPRTGGEQ